MKSSTELYISDAVESQHIDFFKRFHSTLVFKVCDIIPRENRLYH